jgi:hypothetical protein
MEDLAAALTGAFLSLLFWDLAWGNHSLVAKHGGARLLKVVRKDAFRSRWKPSVLRACWWSLWLFLLLVTLFVYFVDGEPIPTMTFSLALLALMFIGFERPPRGYVQLLEHGIVLAVKNRIAFVPYTFVQYCQWQRGSPRLLVRMKITDERCTFRDRDVEAVTCVLASHVEVRFESEAITLGPTIWERPPRPAPDADDSRLPTEPVFARFQFTLRTLLLAALVASAASGWLGIRVRRSGQQAAALEEIDSFRPSRTRSNGYLRSLDFSSSPSKPGDEDLEPLEALTGLRWLNLNGSNATDAGMVHLRNLRRLERLSLSGTRITDAGLVHLHGLKSLDYVDLIGTRVTGQGVADLREAVPGVVVDH